MFTYQIFQLNNREGKMFDYELYLELTFKLGSYRDQKTYFSANKELSLPDKSLKKKILKRT